VVLVAIGAAFLGFVFTLLLRRPCHALGLVDVPDARKQHGRVVPITGGPAVAIAVITLAMYFSDQQAWHIYSAGLLLLITGIADDRYGLSVRARLATQLIAAGILVSGGLVVTSMGSLGELGSMSVPFTVLCIVAFINACNMVDGADGLLAGVTAPACLALALVVPESLQAMALLMGGALLGFLVVNFPAHPTSRRAEWRSFLGNGGVQFVAVTLAALMLAAVGPGGSLKPGAVQWLVLIPLAELSNTFARRLLGRKTSLTSADRSHFHHRLHAVGVSPTALALGYTAVATASVAIGILGSYGFLTDAALWALGGAILGASTTYAVMPHAYSHQYVHGSAPAQGAQPAPQLQYAEQEAALQRAAVDSREAA
jgi:UDP-GlcNAc:undecaprenyl-phosphate GlcNAc-1-phosphate transferase